MNFLVYFNQIIQFRLTAVEAVYAYCHKQVKSGHYRHLELKVTPPGFLFLYIQQLKAKRCSIYNEIK